MRFRRRDDVGEDRAAADRPDTRGTHTWWLIDRATVGSARVVLNVGDMPPGTAHQLHRHAHAEQALYVAKGRGVHLRDGEEPVEIEEGAGVFIPAGEWHGFANPFDEPVTIVSVYGGVGDRSEAGYELHPGDAFEPAAYGVDHNSPPAE